MHVGTEERIGLTTDCGDSSEDESKGRAGAHLQQVGKRLPGPAGSKEVGK